MVLRTINKFLGEGKSDFEDQSAGSAVLALLFLPFRLLWGFAVFMVFAWTTSRSGRAFLFAIPAMATAVIFVGAIWAVGFKGESKALNVSVFYYTRLSNPDEVSYNPEAALFLAKKITEIRPEEVGYQYELGLSYDRLEKYPRAFDVMQWISPLVELDSEEAADGYADGHLWLAANYNNPAKIDMPDDVREKIGRQHVNLSYESNRENAFAVLGMAGLAQKDASKLRKEADELREKEEFQLANEKDQLADDTSRQAAKYLNEAIELRLVTEHQLFASTIVVEILQELGENEAARMTGLRFINRHQPNAIKYPDVLPFWVSIVKTCILIDDFDRAEKFIRLGFQLAQEPDIRHTLVRLAAQIDVQKSKSFEDMDVEKQFLARLYALSSAIKSDVQVPEGYTELVYFIDGFDFDSDKDDWLRDSLYGTAGTGEIGAALDPRIPGVIHIVLGMREIVDGNKEDGQKHWEIAGQQFQLAPFAINYMIQVYASERELEHEQRHELISFAIEIFPQSPHFYSTRGRYLKEHENFKDAIDDLEFAAARIPESVTIMENLVECFQQIGETENARKYQDLIDEIESRIEVDPLTGFAPAQAE